MGRRQMINKLVMVVKQLEKWHTEELTYHPMGMWDRCDPWNWPVNSECPDLKR